MRRIALERLAKYGLGVVRLPVEADLDPTIKHVRIIASPNLAAAANVLLIAPDSDASDLGIHSFRLTTHGFVRDGCMESLVEGAMAWGYDGIVIANPAGVYWDKVTRSAVTLQSWKAREMKMVQPYLGAVLDSNNERIPGHENPESHIASVLAHVKQQLNPEALVDFIATGYTAFALLQGLSNDFPAWKNHAHAAVLAESAHSIEDFSNHELRDFIRNRCRNFVIHNTPLGTYVEPNLQQAVNCYSCGYAATSAEIVPICAAEIFKYFNRAYYLEEKSVPLSLQYEEEGECSLNRQIPIIMGDEFGAAHKEWIKQLSKLNLGHDAPGWEVPGAEVVEKLRQMAEEEKSTWEHTVNALRGDRGCSTNCASPTVYSTEKPSTASDTGAPATVSDTDNALSDVGDEKGEQFSDADR